MFYSHQHLARKAPLGQIWMAATMRSKFNRRKLDKLNIIQVCEEILNPAVPMALRLSGILMGGVVIVYERKVKLLYDDVTRLMVEINEAWKVKTISDPTVLPNRKSQVKKEAVTLTENVERDIRDLEQSLNYTIPDMDLHQTAYFAMRLDSVDESYINNKISEDPSAKFHQADAENITLFESFDMCQANGDRYNRFERFDIEEDDEIRLNFTSGGHSQIPTTLITSSPRQDGIPKINEIEDMFAEQDVHVHSDERKEPKQDVKRQGATKGHRKKAPTFVMDYQQTIIPGHIYQSWLQNASDIVSRRGRKRKRTNFMSTMKIAFLLDLPPVVLSCGLLATGSGEIHYPSPLLHLWRRSIQPPNNSPYEKTVKPLPPRPSSSSSPPGGYYQDHTSFSFQDYNSGGGPQSLRVSSEKLMTNLSNRDMPTQNLDGLGVTQANAYTIGTPRNSGDRVGSDLRLIPEVWTRSNKKRPYSSSGGLEPVPEKMSWLLPTTDPNFKLLRHDEYGPSPDQELLVETGPTQTQNPDKELNIFIAQLLVETGPTQTQNLDNTPPSHKITDSIIIQMKAHFETLGASQVESLDHLALGMNRKGAALLFYQTCVLATRDILKVHQQQPFAEIFLSKGPKM